MANREIEIGQSQVELSDARLAAKPEPPREGQSTAAGIKEQGANPASANPNSSISLTTTDVSGVQRGHTAGATSRVDTEERRTPASSAGRATTTPPAPDHSIVRENADSPKTQEHKDSPGFWTKVKNGARAIGSDLCDAMGLTSMVRGLGGLATAATGIARWGGNLLADLRCVLSGQTSVLDLAGRALRDISGLGGAIWEGVKGAGNLIKGAGLFFGEMTGITDCVMLLVEGGKGLALLGKAASLALSGNWADAKAQLMQGAMHLGMAAMHTLFAAASIAAIVATAATGGAAFGAIIGVMALRATCRSALKAGVKVAAKHVLEHGAEQLGKAVAAEAAHHLSENVLQESARQAVDEGVKDLAKKVSKEGQTALTNDAMQSTMRQSTEKSVEAMLRKADVPQIVSDLTLKYLEGIESKSVKKLSAEIAEEMEKKGVKLTKEAAEEMAKGFKQLKDLLQSGKRDAEIKQILEDGITKSLKKEIEEGHNKAFEREFKLRLTQALRGELKEGCGKELQESSQVLAKALREQAEEAAKKSGKKVEEEMKKRLDELVEAGWKGAREGIEKAVRKVVREGIEDAFKRFRNRHSNSMMSAPENALKNDDKKIIPVEFDAPKPKAKAEETAASKRAGEAERGREQHKTVVAEIDGKLMRQDYVVLASGELKLENSQCLREEVQRNLLEKKEKVA